MVVRPEMKIAPQRMNSSISSDKAAGLDEICGSSSPGGEDLGLQATGETHLKRPGRPS